MAHEQHIDQDEQRLREDQARDKGSREVTHLVDSETADEASGPAAYPTSGTLPKKPSLGAPESKPGNHSFRSEKDAR